MPSIHDLLGDNKTVAVVFGAETAKVTYRPDAVTPRLQSRFQRAQREIKIAEAEQREPDVDIFELLAGMAELFLVSWDITDADGDLWPISQESLMDLPSVILTRVLNRVFEEEGEALDEGEDETSSVSS